MVQVAEAARSQDVAKVDHEQVGCPKKANVKTQENPNSKGEQFIGRSATLPGCQKELSAQAEDRREQQEEVLVRKPTARKRLLKLIFQVLTHEVDESLFAPIPLLDGSKDEISWARRA